MGIGLAIAHGLAQVIGATITVASEPNKGSSFSATVPSPSDGVTLRT
jgi:signal transduction histidine kinase